MVPGGKCFYRAEEWWNYEVCYKKHVKQFHTEGETTVDEYSLGTYDEAATQLNDVKVTLTTTFLLPVLRMCACPTSLCVASCIFSTA